MCVIWFNGHLNYFESSKLILNVCFRLWMFCWLYTSRHVMIIMIITCNYHRVFFSYYSNDITVYELCSKKNIWYFRSNENDGQNTNTKNKKKQ